MLDPTGLYNYASHVDPRTIRANTLVVTIGALVQTRDTCSD